MVNYRKFDRTYMDFIYGKGKGKIRHRRDRDDS
jgi:hypothetical protein